MLPTDVSAAIKRLKRNNWLLTLTNTTAGILKDGGNPPFRCSLICSTGDSLQEKHQTAYNVTKYGRHSLNQKLQYTFPTNCVHLFFQELLCNMLSNCIYPMKQAGFRSGFSITDHLQERTDEYNITSFHQRGVRFLLTSYLQKLNIMQIHKYEGSCSSLTRMRSQTHAHERTHKMNAECS